MNRSFSTIGEAWAQASSFFAGQGVPEPQTAARILLGHVLGMDSARLYLNWNEPFPEEKRSPWQEAIRRKAAGEPVQYIVGEQYFYGLAFEVNSSVLIPRPETELLVERILHCGQRIFAGDESPYAADIGTGSGAIAVTLAVKRPRWQVAATDLSENALSVARRNAMRHGVDGRIAFFQGDLLEPLIGRHQGADIVVANLPYVPSGEIPSLQREVRCYEPHLALDGGHDGLDLYRKLIGQMAGLPRTPRLVGFEVGMGQAEEMAKLLQRCGMWRQIDIVSDLAGIPRHVLAFQ